MSAQAQESKLREGLAKLALSLSDGQIAALESYTQQVLEFNKGYNLMKAENRSEFEVSHLLDSLAACQAIESLAKEISASGKEVRIGDIGSGGGCPGIPLAVAFPQYTFTLVERMEKRCAFLEQVVRSLNLKNAKVLCLQADKVKPESFSIEVFRAFHPFDTKITKLLLGMLCKGGYIAAYKARSEKITAEMEAISFMVPSYKKIALTVPFLEDHERNLVVIQK
ncbi:MAG: 16S rRNA (guanine(527)-N(7))-methyltransferase RsmG [Treponema sp.]|nr:16S rRNA (guanine(527)-N(7))-methyltransferase RsmG [Treponema sp.]